MALCPSVGRGSYPLAPSFPPSSSQGGQVPEPGFSSLNKKLDVWQTQCVRPTANPCGQVAAVVWSCGQVFDLSICPYVGASCPSSGFLVSFDLVSCVKGANPLGRIDAARRQTAGGFARGLSHIKQVLKQQVFRLVSTSI